MVVEVEEGGIRDDNEVVVLIMVIEIEEGGGPDDNEAAVLYYSNGSK